MKAMILAAGLGTRLKPFTDKHPKALVMVNGKTLLERNIAYLSNAGVKEIIINVHHFADQLIAAISSYERPGIKLFISDETDEVLETGGGLKKVRHFFEEDTGAFILMNADILTDLDLLQMKQVHDRSHSLATLAVTQRSTSRYLLFNCVNLLCGWRNEKTGEQKGEDGGKKAFSGIHIISPGIFPLITEHGKFSMIDLYLRLAPDHAIQAFDHSDSRFIDVGKPESIAEAKKLF